MLRVSHLTGFSAYTVVAAVDATLLSGETDGLAIDWTATADFALPTWAMQAVQERNASVDTLQSPHVFFTQSGTSPEYIKNSATTIGWSPHNLLVQSQNLGTTWTNTRSTEALDSTTAPDGTLTADTLVADGTAANTHLMTQAGAGFVVGYVYTFSVYAKQGPGLLTWMATSATGGAWFQLTGAGTVGTLQAGVLTASIESVGSGWYRCSQSFTAASTTPTLGLFLAEGDNDITFNGDSSSGTYFWGMQANRGYFPVPYIATTTAARIGLPISYGEGLLIEPAATNLLLQSENLGTTWTNSNSTETLNATTAPDVSVTADKLVEASDTGQVHSINQTSASVTSGTTYTFSCYLKAAERTWARLQGATTRFADNFHADFNLGAGTVGTVGAGATISGIQSIGDGWYRCFIGAACDSTGTNVFNVVIGEGDTDVTYNGNGTSGIYVWGAQLESGEVVTSYVPTVTATATRATDAINVATSAYPHSDTTATYIIWTKHKIANNAAATRLFDMNDGTGNEQLIGLLDAGETPDGIGVSVVDGGVSQVDGAVTEDGAVNISTGNKTAIAAELNNVGIVVDAGAQVTDTSVTMPVVTALNLGYSALVANRELNGLILRYIEVPRRMTEAEMQAKTT